MRKKPRQGQHAASRAPAAPPSENARLAERTQSIADQAEAMAQTCAERLRVLAGGALAEPIEATALPQLPRAVGKGEETLCRSIGERYAAMARLLARLFRPDALNGARAQRLAESVEILEADGVGLAYGGDRDLEGEWSSWYHLHDLILHELLEQPRLPRRAVPRGSLGSLIALAQHPLEAPSADEAPARFVAAGLEFIEAFLDLGTDDGTVKVATYLRVANAQARAFQTLALAAWSTPLFALRASRDAGPRRLPQVGADLRPEAGGFAAAPGPSELGRPLDQLVEPGLLEILRRDPEETLEESRDQLDLAPSGAPPEATIEELTDARAAADSDRLLGAPGLAGLMPGPGGEEDPALLAFRDWHRWLYEVARDTVGLCDQVDEELLGHVVVGPGRRARLPPPEVVDAFDAGLGQLEGDLQILLAVGWPTLAQHLRRRLSIAVSSGALPALYAGDPAASAPAVDVPLDDPVARAWLTGLLYVEELARAYLIVFERYRRADGADVETFFFLAASLQAKTLDLLSRVVALRALVRALRSGLGRELGGKPGRAPRGPEKRPEKRRGPKA